MKHIKFVLSIPKRYCLIKSDEMQEAADYFRNYYPDAGSLGYSKGDLAQGISDFWKACAAALPPKFIGDDDELN